MESHIHDHERGIGTPTAPCKHSQSCTAVRAALATMSHEDLNRACNLLTAVTASDLYQSLVKSEGTSEAAPIPNSLIQPFLDQLVTVEGQIQLGEKMEKDRDVGMSQREPIPQHSPPKRRCKSITVVVLGKESCGKSSTIGSLIYKLRDGDVDLFRFEGIINIFKEREIHRHNDPLLGDSDNTVHAGPWGHLELLPGQGGEQPPGWPWILQTYGGKIVSINITSGAHVYTLEFITTIGKDNITEYTSGIFTFLAPNTDYKSDTIKFVDDEEITAISGTIGPYPLFEQRTAITSLSFHTNKKLYGPFGTLGTTSSFTLPITSGKFEGFVGRSHDVLYSIGAVLVP